MKYIYHHLGLGDHIICNGMVREFNKQFGDLTLFVKEHNYKSVSFMFRDVELHCIVVQNDDDVKKFVQFNPKIDLIPILCSSSISNEESMDETFYKIAGLSHSKRWGSFKIDRDLIKEKQIFDYYGVEKNQYIFIHDDIDRDIGINMDLVRKDLKIIRPNPKMTENIFEYCYLLENASEIHCIDSCFRILLEHIETSAILYFHTYAKIKWNVASFGWGIPKSFKHWNII